MKQRILAIIFCLISALSFSQKNTDEQLALQFFNNKEYDKAIVYYEKLYSDRNSSAYYQYYFKCLLYTKEYKKAEKIAKRQLKFSPESVFLYLDIADVYKAQGDEKKAEEQYDKAIKELPNDYTQINALANAFRSNKLYDRAIETYKKGRKFNEGIYPFYYEVAEVYRDKGDTRGMINEYLDALDFRDTELTNVQNNLQNSLGYDDEKGGFNNPVLKQELQKRIQSNPEKTIFSEFLIFILLQQKDFDAAFAQSKAIDKRKKEDGYRMMELGKICVSNENYEVAEKCFEYIISKGQSNYYYNQAYIEAANAQFDKIVKQRNYTPQDLTDLESKLQVTIKQFDGSLITVPLIRKLAVLSAFYLNKSAEAIDMLQKAIEMPGIDKHAQAECKLDLGDIVLVAGDIWEASLLYSQVDKAFKYDVIGQEAKFRNAKLAYYSGDFKWAKAQLDVLKGATSKLIANDAMDLSLVIGDAINIDTNEVPLQMFSSADLLIIRNKTDEAMARLDSINILFDNHSLADDIYFKKGTIYTKQGKYKEAIDAFQRVVDNYGEEIFGDDALFRIADIYQYNLKDLEKAKTLYQDLLVKYPGSVFTVEARKRFRKLRGDSIN
ncbi:MAG: tetratricopeptide repeat protein [Bacteroidia bacterium]